MDQPQVYTSPLSWASLPPPTLSHTSRLLQSPSLSFLCAKSPQSCWTLCDPVSTRLQTVHGILQPRIREWAAISFSMSSLSHTVNSQCGLFLNLFQYCFCFKFWYLGPQGMWDPSFPTRDQTTSPALEGAVLTTGLPGKSPEICFYKLNF